MRHATQGDCPCPSLPPSGRPSRRRGSPPVTDLAHGIDPQEAIAPQVMRALREAIVRTDLPPGALISEADIARRFGVSRQPVREAFIKLQEAGLVGIRPQRGTQVLRISMEEVVNARFVREAVEAAVVHEAAETRPAGLAPRLAALIAEQEKAAEAGDGVDFLRLDEAFHRALAQGIGRDFAWSVLEGIKAQMDRVRFLSFEGATPMADIIGQHRAIVGGIAAGDAPAAEAAMRRHLREILSSLPKIAEAHPDYFVPRDDRAARTAA